MRYPDFLSPGDTIAFIAPSFGCTEEPYLSAYKSALAFFKSRGFNVTEGPNVYRSCGIGKSSSAKDCGDELTRYYLSPENRFLISAGGGETMCEDLDYIDFERIKAARPKWFMGYSDNTNFSYLSATLCDTAAFYGENAGAFGMNPLHESVTDAYDLICGKALRVHGYEFFEKESLKSADNPLAGINATEKQLVRSFNYDGSPVSGRFIGGCLDCLINLCGTKFDRTAEFTEKYKDDGIIFFMEACDLSVFGIRRALWQLSHAGWFNHVKAFLIGRPLNFYQQFPGIDHYNAVTDILSGYNVPIINDCDFGHLAPMMTLINGGYGTVSPYNDTIQIEFELK